MQPYPKWKQALDRLALTWTTLSPDEVRKKHAMLVKQGTGNSSMQHNIVYWSDKKSGRAKNKRMYHKHAEQRALDARLSRHKRKSDPVALSAYRVYCRDRARERVVTDINFLLRKKLRTRISMAVKHYAKSAGTEVLTGCSFEFLRQHLEAQWKPGMSWKNYGRGGWHIDHKRPCNSFDLAYPEQQRECFHYSNLQPLWEFENLSKGDN